MTPTATPAPEASTPPASLHRAARAHIESRQRLACAHLAPDVPEHDTPAPHAAAGEQLWRFPVMARTVGLSKSAIYDGIAKGTFPKPVKFGRSALWVRGEITQWIADRIAERSAPASAMAH